MCKQVSDHYIIKIGEQYRQENRNQFELVHGKGKNFKDLDIVYNTIEKNIEANKFTECKKTGMIYVIVRIREDTINEFDSSYFQLEESKKYIEVNPNWREAFDLAYAYPWNMKNIFSTVKRLVALEWRQKRKANWGTRFYAMMLMTLFILFIAAYKKKK